MEDIDIDNLYTGLFNPDEKIESYSPPTIYTNFNNFIKENDLNVDSVQPDEFMVSVTKRHTTLIADKIRNENLLKLRCNISSILINRAFAYEQEVFGQEKKFEQVDFGNFSAFETIQNPENIQDQINTEGNSVLKNEYSIDSEKEEEEEEEEEEREENNQDIIDNSTLPKELENVITNGKAVIITAEEPEDQPTVTISIEKDEYKKNISEAVESEKQFDIAEQKEVIDEEDDHMYDFLKKKEIKPEEKEEEIEYTEEEKAKRAAFASFENVYQTTKKELEEEEPQQFETVNLYKEEKLSRRQKIAQEVRARNAPVKIIPQIPDSVVIHPQAPDTNVVASYIDSITGLDQVKQEFTTVSETHYSRYANITTEPINQSVKKSRFGRKKNQDIEDLDSLNPENAFKAFEVPLIGEEPEEPVKSVKQSNSVSNNVTNNLIEEKKKKEVVVVPFAPPVSIVKPVITSSFSDLFKPDKNNTELQNQPSFQNLFASETLFPTKPTAVTIPKPDNLFDVISFDNKTISEENSQGSIISVESSFADFNTAFPEITVNEKLSAQSPNEKNKFVAPFPVDFNNEKTITENNKNPDFVTQDPPFTEFVEAFPVDFSSMDQKAESAQTNIPDSEFKADFSSFPVDFADQSSKNEEIVQQFPAFDVNKIIQNGPREEVDPYNTVFDPSKVHIVQDTTKPEDLLDF